jgi:hypothetical protein
MKILISTIVGAIVLFILSWLTYGVILAKYMAQFGPSMRTEADMRFWAIIVGTILQAFFLAYIYTKVYKGESPIKEGFLFGFLLSLLVYLPYIFFFWGSYAITYKLIIADGVLMGIRMTIAAIVIALIIGKKEKAIES